MPTLRGPLFSIVGLAALGLAYLCATQRLGRNRFVGIRTTATLRSDDAWYAAHRASAWSIAVAGSVSLGVGLWLVLADPTETTVASAVIATSVVVLVVIAVGGVQAHRAARRVVEDRSSRR